MAEQLLYDEHELLLRISEGDEQAYTILFGRYHARLFNYIHKLTLSREVSEELVLDVFLKLWQGRDVITEIKNMDGFLFKIAHNKSLDFLRSAHQNRRFADLAWDQLQLTDGDNPATVLIKQEYDRLLHDSIQLLPAQRRKVYQMNREQEKSYREIADELSISQNTVNMHMYEARQFIRSYLLKHIDLGMLLVLLGENLTKK